MTQAYNHNRHDLFNFLTSNQFMNWPEKDFNKMFDSFENFNKGFDAIDKVSSIVSLIPNFSKEYIVKNYACDKNWAKQNFQYCTNNKFPKCLLNKIDYKNKENSFFVPGMDEFHTVLSKNGINYDFIFKEDGTYTSNSPSNVYGTYGYLICDPKNPTGNFILRPEQKTSEQKNKDFEEQGGSSVWADWLYKFPCFKTVKEWKNNPPEMHSNLVDGKKMYFISVKNLKNNKFYRFYSDGVITDFNGNDTYKKFKCGSDENTGELNTKVIVEGLNRKKITEQIYWDTGDETSTTQTTPVVREEDKFPPLLKDEESRRMFQDWLDSKNFEGWTKKNKDIKKGYGKYDDETKQMFALHKSEFRSFLLEPWTKNTQQQQPTTQPVQPQQPVQPKQPSKADEYLSQFEDI